jgi:hypothetical protein
VFLPAIALPVFHVAAPYQTVACRQNESLLVTARQARCPPASQKVTSFDCRLIPAWCWHAMNNQQSPNGEKGTIP